MSNVIKMPVNVTPDGLRGRALLLENEAARQAATGEGYMVAAAASREAAQFARLAAELCESFMKMATARRA